MKKNNDNDGNNDNNSSLSAMSARIITDHDDDSAVYTYKTSNRGRAAVRGAFWSALNTLIPVALNGLVFVVTSRYLNPSEFGTVALAISIVLFGSGFVPSAFGEALIQRPIIHKTHLDTVFWFCFVCSLLVYVLILGASTYIGASINQPSMGPLLAIIGLKLLFDSMSIVPNALISRTMSFHLVALRTGIATTISAVVCLSLILAGYGLWAIAIAQIASAASSCAAAFWGSWWLPRLKIKKTSLRDLAYYGIFASANRFLQTMNLDQIIIGMLANPASLGIYNFARRLFQMMNELVSGGLTSVTHVLLSSLQHDQERVRKAFLMATFCCSVVSFPAFIGMAVVAPEIISVIFGQQWLLAVWPVRFFCIIGLMGGIGVIQSALINSQGKAKWWFYYQLLRNFMSIVAVLCLYKYGVSWIVFALMMQVFLLWPITLIMTSKLIGLSVRGYFEQFLRPLSAVLFMAFCIEINSLAMAGQNELVLLAANVFVGSLSYLCAIFLLCGARLRLVWALLNSKRSVG